MAAKKTAPKTQYLVTYDVEYDGDPCQVFDTLDKAKKFVADLFTKEDDDNDAEDIVKDSIKVWEAKLIGKPKIEIVFPD